MYQVELHPIVDTRAALTLVLLHWARDYHGEYDVRRPSMDKLGPLPR